MVLRLPHIPLQAKELLNFNYQSILCLAGIFLIGALVLLLLERLCRPRRKWMLRLCMLVFYSLLCAAGTYSLSHRQEETRRMHWAESLSSDRDTRAENIFLKLGSLSGYPPDSIENILKKKLPAYQFYFNLCDKNETLLIGSQSYDCEEFFEKRAGEGSPTGIPGLTVIDYSFEHYAYLYRLKLSDSQSLNIDLGRRKIAGGPGEHGFHLPASYSYAFYEGPHVMSHTGDFLYPYDMGKDSIAEAYFAKRDGYSHLLYPIGGDKTLVLSTPQANPWEILHNFSLFFLLFGVAGALVFIMADRNFFRSSAGYKQRLRSVTYLLVLCSLAAFTVLGVFFMRGLYRNENEKLLRGQALTILAEMENRCAEAGIDNESDLSADINRLCNLFRTDIFCYSPEGELLFTAPTPLLPARLDKDLLEKAALGRDHLSIDEVTPRRGFSALAAIAPFRNTEGRILGYLYILYFWQNEAWRNEMSSFLGIYLTLMMVMSILILLLSSLLADYITRPLAETEREGAWNEMARQVAHEIKNPLTPMKLQVQQLERAYKDGRSDFDERLQKFAGLMTGQIDRLAAIAEGFSQFSKWSEAQMQSVNIPRFLQNIVLLYGESEPEGGNVSSHLNLSVPAAFANLTMEADPKFLEQIFHNLIKNAQQASATEIEAGIRDAHTLYVKDNGPGIDAETARHIFEPRFTTKSSGAGLGLAICRKLCESMGAKIELEKAGCADACFLIHLK